MTCFSICIFTIILQLHFITPLDYNGKSQQLTSVPSNIQASTSRIFLSNNKITTIPTGTFSSFSGVTELYLDKNIIGQLEVGSFQGLTSLRKLILTSNLLTVIPDLQVLGSSLTELYLEKNQIQAVSSAQISTLSSLIVLQLSYNTITGNVQIGHPNLLNLHLDYNDINQLDLSSMVSLKVLTLEGNKELQSPWTTVCHVANTLIK